MSDTRGMLNICRWAEAELSLVQQWHGHEFEAWIAAFDSCNRDIAYSGIVEN